MQDTDEAGSETFRFVFRLEHSEDNAADSKKKTVKQCPVSKEKRSQFFSNSEDAVPVGNVNEFEGH